ncbi:MAG: hypothetical protein F4053_08125 [Proteobacteria bacterium]|nr:hypothetical protein [Pseudomonadota bacterium]MYJ95534.1 hypothetical protein [Pseudomonadota bacterium]
MTTRARFDIYVNSRATGIVHAADCVVEEDAGFVHRVDFRYTPVYLGNPGRFSLDPAGLPLAPGETRFRCQGGAPGFIDDHLPDAWGRKILTALAHYRDGRRLNADSAIDLLALVKGGERIGALAFVDVGATPGFFHGAPLELLSQVEWAAAQVDASDWRSIGLDEFVRYTPCPHGKRDGRRQTESVGQRRCEPLPREVQPPDRGRIQLRPRGTCLPRHGASRGP